MLRLGEEIIKGTLLTPKLGGGGGCSWLICYWKVVIYLNVASFCLSMASKGCAEKMNYDVFDTLLPSALITLDSTGLNCLWWLAASACHLWLAICVSAMAWKRLRNITGALFLVGLFFSTTQLCPLPSLQHHSGGIQHFSCQDPWESFRDNILPMGKGALILRRGRPCSGFSQSWIWFEKAS